MIRKKKHATALDNTAEYSPFLTAKRIVFLFSQSPIIIVSNNVTIQIFN